MKTCPLCEKSYADMVRVCAVDGATLVASPLAREPRAGQVIKGRFLVLNKVGSGGTGTVYLAEQINLGKKVALKILNSENSNDVEFVKTFQRDARLAAHLSHPNLVSVVEFDKLGDGRLFIATEYVEGRKLSDIIQNEGPLDVLKALRFGIQIAEGF